MKNSKEIFICILAIVGVIAPLSMLGILIYKDIEPTPLVAGFIGMILGSYPMIFQYYFGSSSGSRDKQDTIDKMTAAIPLAIDPVLEAKKKLWKDSGSTLTFDQWIEEKKTAYAQSGSTVPFDEWLKTQK